MNILGISAYYHDSAACLVVDGEIIGAALRTKRKAGPIYVSIGHKVDLSTAIYWILQCCHGYRLPEPCRLAHLTAAGKSIATSKTNPGYSLKLFD